jgi:hypothetical protein
MLYLPAVEFPAQAGPCPILSRELVTSEEAAWAWATEEIRQLRAAHEWAKDYLQARPDAGGDEIVNHGLPAEDLHRALSYVHRGSVYHAHAAFPRIYPFPDPR